jgi:hypothetical protein
MRRFYRRWTTFLQLTSVATESGQAMSEASIEGCNKMSEKKKHPESQKAQRFRMDG